MKVLLVDDSPAMRNIFKRVMPALGRVEFTEAGDGLEALSIIAATPAGFDVVLVDWGMPNMDGITLVRRIRESDQATPIIMVSTETDKSQVMGAIEAGVNNYVVKPFTPKQLVDRVKLTLKKARCAAL